MNSSRDVVQASYTACRRAARRAGSNFYPCFLRLPPAKRRAMDALYAFMRYTDDLIDDPQPRQQPHEALARWRAALEHALLGRFDNHPGTNLLPALTDTLKRFQVPPKYLHAVIDGVEMDLTRRRYETFAELEQYCRHVASAVGVACIHIWGFRDRQALEPAEKCGIAMQLTNILRDLGEDARQDRVYLPLEDLRHFGYSVEELIRGVADDRFVRLMQFQIARAEQFYREGAELIHWLEPDGRRTFGMMTAIYHALLKKIARRPRDVLTHRLRVSPWKKCQIALRHILP